MPQDYVVQSGDCISSIAYENGFFWKTLWNLSQNAGLKSKRKNPNVLLAGDIVHIPDLRIKQEPGATEKRHKFRLKGVPEKLRMKLLDANHKPRANLDYIIIIDGNSRRGTTDGNGELIESIPPNAKSGKIVLAGDNTHPITLSLGHLDPISEVSGLKSRLLNLGFYKGPIDGNFDDATKQAICAFQTKQGLPVTGVADDATTAQLQKAHGH
ncbi:MAG TPA: peptidoglycan-binding domain-containing protein [Verrucomicrobiae bacterium]|jgi:N-acetylmuramoyl-L-alanine amidase|nr:peptidoglycan-binding domain-containing protein [Verrucomicrobiae bacterium]